MALSGSFKTSGWETSSGAVVSLLFSWTTTQFTSENTSTISWTLQGHRTFGGGYVEAGGFKVVIDGDTVYSKSTSDRIKLYNGTVVAKGTKTITHNSDGSRTFDVYAEAGIYYFAVNCTGNASFTLNTIPRPATITSATDFADVGNPTICFSNPGGFSMDVWLEPNPVGDHICVRAGIPDTGIYTWTLTDEEREALRNRCAGNDCKIRLGLSTHINGTTYSDYKDKTYTITESTVTQPSVHMSVAANNSNLPDIFSGLYIQGKSKANITVSATGKYGATVSSYSTSVDGKTYTPAEFTTEILTKSGVIAIDSSVKDSRGFTGTANTKIAVIPYSAPWLTSFSIERQADGTTVVAHLKGGISPIENKNSKTFSVTLNGVTKSIATSGYDVDDTITFTDVPTDITLTAEAKIIDAFSTAAKNAVVPTVAVTLDFHRSGTGIAMGKVAEHEKLLDVAWDIKYKGNRITDFVIEEGADDTWAYRKWNSGRAEAWLTKELSFTATPSAVLGGYYATTSMGLPGGVFEQPPTCIVMGRIGTGLGFASVGSTSSTSASITVFGNQNGTTSYITALYATGQWK